MVMMGKTLATVVAMVAAAAMPTAQAPAPGATQAPPADISAPPPDAVKIDSGLASRTITPGTSAEKPTPTDIVTVHYTGWTTDGTMVDSSRGRSMPPMFPLNRSLPGWRECVRMMTVGETRRCWVPQELALQRSSRPARRHHRLRHRATRHPPGPNGAAA